MKKFLVEYASGDGHCQCRTICPYCGRNIEQRNIDGELWHVHTCPFCGVLFTPTEGQFEVFVSDNVIGFWQREVWEKITSIFCMGKLLGGDLTKVHLTITQKE